MREEIIGGLRNAISRGESLEQAIKSFINAGYKESEVLDAAKVISHGASNYTTNNSTTNISDLSKKTPNPLKNESKKLISNNLEDKNQFGEKPKVPKILKTISIFNWIVTFMFLFSGIFLIIMGTTALSSEDFLNSLGLGNDNQLAFKIKSAALLFGSLSILFGIVLISAAVGLWKGKRWGKIIQSILSVIFITLSVILVINGLLIVPILIILVNISIITYLFISKKNKESFKSSKINNKENLDSNQQIQIKKSPYIANKLPKSKHKRWPIILGIIIFLLIVILLTLYFLSESILGLIAG